MREFMRLATSAAGNKLVTHDPYCWQHEFYAAGKDNQERLLMAGNRTGKTLTGAVEVAYHLSGLYPPAWKGKCFDKPVLVWTASPTNETSKDILQTQLLGGLGEVLGTGWIPLRLIEGQPTTRQAGVRNVVDSFKVRHVSGGLSECVMKSFEQGWPKYQGSAPHVVWIDEEPEKDFKIFTECQTRVLTSKGILLVTFTPLYGQTALVEHFMRGLPGSYWRGATWDDAPHLDAQGKADLSARYPDYQREARTRGIPMLGEGAVFPVPESDIRVDPFRIPDHWPRGRGIDYGINHPAAGAEMACDPTNDVWYVVDCYKKAGETAAYHAAWFNRANRWIPAFGPHDGLNREKSGGRTLAEHYRSHGVNVFSKTARYPKNHWNETEKGGPQPVEPIVEKLLERMRTGQFKVFSTCTGFFEEFRSYHRRDGRLATTRDDILKSVFYCCMMRNYWTTAAYAVPRPKYPTQPIATSRL